MINKEFDEKNLYKVEIIEKIAFGMFIQEYYFLNPSIIMDKKILSNTIEIWKSYKEKKRRKIFYLLAEKIYDTKEIK